MFEYVFSFLAWLRGLNHLHNSAIQKVLSTTLCVVQTSFSHEEQFQNKSHKCKNRHRVIVVRAFLKTRRGLLRKWAANKRGPDVFISTGHKLPFEGEHSGLICLKQLFSIQISSMSSPPEKSEIMLLSRRKEAGVVIRRVM